MKMVVLLNKYTLGDMRCEYYIDGDTGNVELIIVPESKKDTEWEKKNQKIDSLLQIKLVGDTYPGGYSGGKTMRQGESVTGFKYKDQEVIRNNDKVEICTTLSDHRGYEAAHYLVWSSGSKYIEVYNTFQNQSNQTVKLEMISSFSLGGISPFLAGDGHDRMKVHRFRSVWSMEGRLDTRTIEELQLEPSWAGHAVRSERFGQAGSMPVNQYFPSLILEDSENDVFWGAMLAHNASWQMEIYRIDDGISISGGIADREFGHWMKEIHPGERFITPSAILSVCKGGGCDRISQRMTSCLNEVLDQGPESEQSLPVVFNEYCTTWGCPSHENIGGILEAIKGKGFDYFVIDCGWYKEEGIPWYSSMGDYNVSSDLFPDGLDKTVEAIKATGMKPGIWFEIENVGSAAKAYNEEDHLLKRDGVTLTTTNRRFWDMRDPWVTNYLKDKVIGTLKKYQFEYIKIDYNDTIGIGCDGAESLGEGLRQNMEAAFEFIKTMKQEIPGIIIENCASGGHRLEAKMMSISSMASFSDAHECPEIPIIAANLHRTILPRQSQIWAVIRKEDSIQRITYSIINTFLGRMCLSGDVTELSSDQWSAIDRGIAFYKRIAPIIKDGYTLYYGNKIKSYRNPKGWQGILRVSEHGDAYALYHLFEGDMERDLIITIPEGYHYEIKEVYSDTDCEVRIEDGKLIYRSNGNWRAVAVYLGSSKL
jgi:alpha-galactosidase